MEKDNYTDSIINDILKEAYFSKYLDPKFCYKKTGNEANIFYDGLSRKLIDIEMFHAAFDEELYDVNLLSLFNENGLLKNKATYGEIKKYLNIDSAVFNALLKLWTAQFSYLYPTKEEKIADVKKELSK